MNKILVIEDETAILNMVKLCLTKNGYMCDIAENGIEGLKKVEEKRFDLILLDIMLPDMDGYEILSYIKEYNIPTIFVTAKTAIKDRVKGLKLGAEDYIIKPFDLEELLARIETVLRRYNKIERYITINDIKIDTLSRTVYKGENIVLLSAKEYELLLYLVRNKGIALYREKIFEQVWQEPYYANTRTIDLHIQRLKKKLQLYNNIEAVYKIGYKFVMEND